MLHVRPRRGAVATVGGSCFVADLLKPFVVGEEQLKKTWRFVLRWRGVVEEDSEIRSSPIYSNQVRCFRFVVGGSSVRRCFSNKGGLREVGEGGGRVSSAIAGWLGWTLVGPQASAGRCVPGTTRALLSARPSGTAVTPFILLGHAAGWCRVRSKVREGAARDGVVDMGRCMFAAYLALVVATGRHIPSLLGGGGVRSYRVGWTCMVYVASGKEIAWIVIHVDGIKRREFAGDHPPPSLLVPLACCRRRREKRQGRRPSRATPSEQGRKTKTLRWPFPPALPVVVAAVAAPNEGRGSLNCDSACCPVSPVRRGLPFTSTMHHRGEELLLPSSRRNGEGRSANHTAALYRPASPSRRSAWLAENRGARPHCEAPAGEKNRCRWLFAHRRRPLHPAIPRGKAAAEVDRKLLGEVHHCLAGAPPRLVFYPSGYSFYVTVHSQTNRTLRPSETRYVSLLTS
nr:hypothetical protein Iba_chr04fCG14450 [Ipomoea batatas]